MLTRIRYRINSWRMARRLKHAHRVLCKMNDAMKRAGLSRQERKQIWRDVYKGHVDPADLLI